MILCCGEALIDMVPVVDPAAATDGAPTFAAHCGGAVYNTAIALGRLGAPVALVSGVSTDAMGRMLEAGLRASGVDTGLLIRSDRPTTLAMVHLSGGQATYSFYDEGSAGRMIRPADLPDAPTQTQAAFFGGISLCMTPVAETALTFAERLAADHVIMLDPNIRPGFADDEAAYRTRISRALKLADIVKLSEDDLDWLCPDMAEADRRNWVLAQGPRAVLVTRGENGATAWLSDGRSLHVDTPRVEVCDTIGAGDTFNAGILAALSDADLLDKAGLERLGDEDWQRAMRLAARAAAVTVSRAGANPPWRAELDETQASKP